MESHDETGCQNPDVPMPCINNCGFFGTAATMYMCSKCHKDMIVKQEQAKLAATSIENMATSSSTIVNGTEPVVTGQVDLQAGPVEVKPVSTEPSSYTFSIQNPEVKAKDGLNRCSTCRKRVGLTGFNCKCGSLFCAVHRYSDKHDCPFDYQTAARDAIAKANPVVKAEKLNKI